MTPTQIRDTAKKIITNRKANIARILIRHPYRLTKTTILIHSQPDQQTLRELNRVKDYYKVVINSKEAISSQEAISHD